MPDCNRELRMAGKPNPRTCAVCGLGRCLRVAIPVPPRSTAQLAIQIAATVFPGAPDRLRRDELTLLLAAFAAEIKRSSIEGTG